MSLKRIEHISDLKVKRLLLEAAERGYKITITKNMRILIRNE